MHKADFVGRPPIILGGNPATGGECIKCYSHSSYFVEIPDEYLKDSNGNIVRDPITMKPIKNSFYTDYVEKWGKPNESNTNNSLPALVTPTTKKKATYYEKDVF